MVLVLFKKINSFLKRIFEELPTNGTLRKMGYKTLMYNGDLFLKKKQGPFFIFLYQSIEPHHPIYKNLIDFEVEDACVVIKCCDEKIDAHHYYLEIRELFDYAFERGRYLFAMDKKMDFNDPKHTERLKKIENILQK